jgi:site-specific DNA-methyltransferase (adenine-specific)
VIVASKGRFDRARSRHQRAREGLPHQDTIYRDDFMSWTTDVWDIATESATRVGHPAPFPVELPQRLIELYTYRGDLVLDPFMGSGSTAVAAIRTGRHFVGFDTEATYVEAALRRAAEARADCELASAREAAWKIVASAPPTTGEKANGFHRQAISEGRAVKQLARDLLERSGFRHIAENPKITAGVEVSLAAQDQTGGTWYFDVSGALSKGNDRPGLKRLDTVWKALGKAAVLRHRDVKGRLVLLTTELPEPRSASGAALETALSAPDGVPGDPLVFDAIDLLRAEAIDRLRRYASEGAAEPEPLWPTRRRPGQRTRQSGHGHRQDQAD